jgi:hypothetical protein
MSSPALPRRRSLPRHLHSPGTPPPRPPSTAENRPIPTAPPARRTGRYRLDVRAGAWWWSPEMYAVLDLCPDVAAPSTDALVARLHADDGPRVLQALARAADGEPLALELRLARGDGTERTVVLLGEPDGDQAGGVDAVEGCCADVTDGRHPGADPDRVHALQTEVLQLRTAMASRACIEQAKGILMLLTNCGDQGAFDLLAHISSHTHRKVRDVAQTITASAVGRSALSDDIRAIIRDACPPNRPPA